MQVALSTPLTATQGLGAPEVGRTFDRAQQLCQQVGETPQLFPVVNGLWGFHFFLANMDKAVQLSDQLFTLAQATMDQSLLLQAPLGHGCDGPFSWQV